MRSSLLYLGIVFLFSWSCFAAPEIIMSRRTLERSNLFRDGDFSFSVSMDEQEPPAWTIKVTDGSQERNVPVDESGVTRIFLPGKILEVRNTPLPKRELWNIMQETIGEFEVRMLEPEDLYTESPVFMEKEANPQKEIYRIDNGFFTLRMLPANNGAIFSLIDRISNCEFLYGRLEAAHDKNSFQKLGFLELVNNYGQTAGVNFHPEMEKKPSGEVIISMSAPLAPDKFQATISRTMVLKPGLPKLTLHSLFTAAGNQQQAFRMKHRPESTFLGRSDKRWLGVLCKKEGILVETAAPAGAIMPESPAYALVDRGRGLLLGVSYAPEDLEQLYLWCDKDYVSLEAWSHKRPLETPLGLKVTYYLIRGMGAANFQGRESALHFPEINPVIHMGTALETTLIYGSASPWQAPEILFSTTDSMDNRVFEHRVPLEAPVPGFAASPVKILLPTEKLPAGSYIVYFRLPCAEIEGKLQLRIVSPQQLDEFHVLLESLDKAIAELRKNYKTLPNEQKKASLRKFRETLLLRETCAEAMKNGDIDKLESLKTQLK